MQINSTRTNRNSGAIKIVRLKTPGARTLLMPSAGALEPTRNNAREMLKPYSDGLVETSADEERSPAARARKAKRRLRRLFEHAIRNARGRARLCRADEYEMLWVAYRAVRAWRNDGVHDEIERQLRAGAEV